MTNIEKIAVLQTLATELGITNFPKTLSRETVNYLFTGLGDVEGLANSPIKHFFLYNKYMNRPDLTNSSSADMIKVYSIDFTVDVVKTLFYYSLTTNQKNCIDTCLKLFISTGQTDFTSPAPIEVVEEPEPVAVAEVVEEEPVEEVVEEASDSEELEED